MSRITCFMSFSTFLNDYECISAPFDITIRFSGYRNVDMWNFPDVIYTDWLFYWNETPGAEIHYQGTVYALKPDMVALIPPYTVFSTRAKQSFRQFYLHFHAPFPYDSGKRGIYIFPAEAVQRMQHQMTGKATIHTSAIALRLMLYHYLCQIPEEDLTSENHGIPPGIRRAAEWISRNRNKTVTNVEIARYAGIPVNSFYREFQAALGMTPKEYRQTQRLEYTRQLLLSDPEMSIEEIAELGGYSDRFQFSKAFRKNYGIAPAAYRKR